MKKVDVNCKKCPFRTPICTALGNVCYLEVMEHAPNATLVMARKSRTSLSDVADYILRKRESDEKNVSQTFVDEWIGEKQHGRNGKAD